MKLTKYGMREWLGSGIIAALLLALTIIAGVKAHQPSIFLFSALIMTAWLCIAAFFRDPARKIPEENDILLSPADGVVKDIELISGNDGISCFDGKASIRVGIFLSVLNVHLNRAPCDMTAESLFYKEGSFHDARNPMASRENESMLLCASANAGNKIFPIGIKQISGAIARRIVCPVLKGMVFKKGDIYGMIKFGSRTELYFPATPDIQLQVKVGDKVSAGTSVIARVSS